MGEREGMDPFCRKSGGLLLQPNWLVHCLCLLQIFLGQYGTFCYAWQTWQEAPCVAYSEWRNVHYLCEVWTLKICGKGPWKCDRQLTLEAKTAKWDIASIALSWFICLYKRNFASFLYVSKFWNSASLSVFVALALARLLKALGSIHGSKITA